MLNVSTYVLPTFLDLKPWPVFAFFKRSDVRTPLGVGCESACLDDGWVRVRPGRIPWGMFCPLSFFSPSGVYVS